MFLTESSDRVNLGLSQKTASSNLPQLYIWEGVFLRRFAYDFPREDLEIMAQEIRNFLGIEPL
jgi:hypothetical protein